MVLPSMGKIKAAINKQQLQIASGGLLQTDKAVIGAVNQNTIVVVDASVVNTASNANPGNPNNSGGMPNPAVVAALGTNFDFSSGPIPSGLLFLSPAIVFKASDLGLPNGLIPNNQLAITGVIGGALTASGSVDLSVLDGLKEADIFASNGMTFSDSTTFTGLSSTRNLTIYTEIFSFGTPDSGPLIIEADFDTSAQTFFAMESISEADLSNVELTNPTGTVVVGSVLGDVNLDSSSLLAGGGDIILASDTGSVSVTDGSFLSATNGFVGVDSGRDITIADSTLAATTGTTSDSGQIDIEAGGSATVTNTALLADSVLAEANDQLTVNNVNFSSTAQSISMSARTVVLYNVNFPGASVVTLDSLSGLLAANPNTGATVVPGDVNFVRNVNYNGLPAQEFIPVSAGGTGQFPTRISIGKM
jgi:hypothetical protein